jgi:hypothetical protein
MSVSSTPVDLKLSEMRSNSQLQPLYDLRFEDLSILEQRHGFGVTSKLFVIVSVTE